MKRPPLFKGRWLPEGQTEGYLLGAAASRINAPGPSWGKKPPQGGLFYVPKHAALRPPLFKGRWPEGAEGYLLGAAARLTATAGRSFGRLRPQLALLPRAFFKQRINGGKREKPPLFKGRWLPAGQTEGYLLVAAASRINAPRPPCIHSKKPFTAFHEDTLPLFTPCRRPQAALPPSRSPCRPF